MLDLRKKEAMDSAAAMMAYVKGTLPFCKPLIHWLAD
jgi:hypothetical protein